MMAGRESPNAPNGSGVRTITAGETDRSGPDRPPARLDAAALGRVLARVHQGPLPAEAELTAPVAATIAALAGEIDRQDRALAEAEERASVLAELADRDPLLELFNRRAFERELARMAAIVERYESQASVVFIDLNKFKWINDVYGHQAGDAVLAHVAGIIKANVRSSDIVGRLGGDEFAVILVQAGKEAAVAKAERLEAIIATTPIEIEGTTILLTASAGAEEITGTTDLKARLDSADQAMYRRKEEYHAGDQR